MQTLEELDALLLKHHNEASEGIVDQPPSRLTRGQGCEKNFYIFKIDLVNSTFLMAGQRKATYLRIAHSFLSTIDQITKDYGADSSQTEYAGDSVIAYFPEEVSAENVLRAACLSKVAVERIAKLQTDPALARLNCRVVIHSAPLIVAKIGPRAETHLNAIGQPIHLVAKLEKKIAAGIGLATQEYYSQIHRDNRKYFTSLYEEIREPITTPPTHSAHTNALAQALYPSSNISAAIAPPTHSAFTNELAQALYSSSNASSATTSQFPTAKPLLGYSINWLAVKHALGLNPRTPYK